MWQSNFASVVIAHVVIHLYTYIKYLGNFFYILKLKYVFNGIVYFCSRLSPSRLQFENRCESVIRASRERQAEKKADRGRAKQNAVCVFRIKGRRTVDFPGRYLSDSPRHSRRHLRFSILRKRTRPPDTYYAVPVPLLPRLLSSSSPPRAPLISTST